MRFSRKVGGGSALQSAVASGLLHFRSALDRTPYDNKGRTWGRAEQNRIPGHSHWIGSGATPRVQPGRRLTSGRGGSGKGRVERTGLNR